MQSLLPQDLALKWRRIVASSDRRTITTDAPPAAAGGADPSLDPDEWSGLRALGHQMLDDVFNELQGIRAGPVWRPMPDDVRGAWSDALPRVGVPLADVYDEYQRLIAPYTVGNRHPRFFGWVHGAGTAVGVLAEMLASGLNANCGGRDHAPIACERQVIRWAAEMLGLPRDSSGLVVTGTSVANLVAVIIARSAALGPAVRRDGIGESKLVAYASAAVHLCVGRALDITGLGARALRLIPCDTAGAMDVAALRAAIAADRERNMLPFLVVGTAGSVDIGAIDHLSEIANVCVEQRLWFHVDAAFGAIAMLSAALRPLFAGIERADSVAFDFHKWAQVPYDAGCIVVRDAAAHEAAFAHQAAYLKYQMRGLAAGRPWPVDLGPELSRGFRALKVWMTIKAFGANRLGDVAERSCLLARRFAAAIDNEPLLERTAPVRLNIVCFRYRPGDDELQTAIAADLQEAGDVVLSTTTIGGRTVLRAAFVNHRSDEGDADAVIPAVLGAGLRRLGAAAVAADQASHTPD
jgi:glutamate/tyrosine decarboxylase-like PLP-dependent enzyme